MRYRLGVLSAVLSAMCFLGALAYADDAARPLGIKQRTPWTTSRIKGSPTPPAPYKTERIFPKLQFRNPVLLSAAP